MTRNQAVRKLQLSLPDFRKLCILKGIYPREPPKKFAGNTSTYYLAKDLRFMMHDPLVEKFRDHRAWRHKVKKAQKRKLKDKVERLMKNEPKYTLTHLVKERYPTFMDAIRDLDDAITMIHLFMLMPTKTIKAKRLENCRRLALEFQYFIVRSRALRKVFISIKGIYFQAELFGQTITWIVPHRFNQKTSNDVDYSVMTTFLEFHEVLMGFVNYKLFNSIGVKYPLVIDAEKAGEGEHLKALSAEPIGEDSSFNPRAVPKSVLKATERRIHSLDDLLRKVARDDAKSVTSSSAPSTESSSSKQVEEEEKGDVFDEDERREQQALENFKNLFSGCVVFVSREVPRENIEFIVRAFGGQVSWDGGSIAETSNQITHQIVDRGVEPANRRVDREYIQPQWLFDCVNARILLPVDIYGPTAKLPPHLSPFVDSETDGYTPEFQQKIQEYIAAAHAQGPSSGAAPTIDMDEDAVSSDSDESSEDEETTYARELAEERKGKASSSKAQDEDDDDHDDDDDEDAVEKDAHSEEEVEGGAESMDVDEDYVDEMDAYMAKHSLRNRGIRREFDAKRKRSQNEADEEEAQAMAQAMLPNKKRKLLEHLQRGKRRAEDRTYTLEDKKKKIASKELVPNADGILVKASKTK
jgi:pescadillo protein